MEKNPDPGSRMNIPDYFFESIETVLNSFEQLKILKFLDADPDPGSKIFYPVSGINIYISLKMNALRYRKDVTAINTIFLSLKTKGNNSSVLYLCSSAS